MNETHHIAVRRTARICTLGEPGPATRGVWLVCHGYGQLAGRFIRRFEPLDDGRHWVVAPEALNRFYLDARPAPHGPASPVGATWMTREDRLTDIADCMHYLDRVHSWILERLSAKAVRLNVLGFSQGMSTVVRWAVATAARIDRLVLWAGSWPPEIEPSAGLFGGSRLSLVAGTRDRSIDEEGLGRLVASLQRAGLEPDVLRYDGDHDIDPGALHQLVVHDA